MSNIPESCISEALTSSVILVEINSDLDRLIRHLINTSLITTLLCWRQTLQRFIDTYDVALDSDTKHLPSIPDHDTAYVLNMSLQCLFYPKLHAEIIQIAQEEARRLRLLEMDALIKLCGEALLNALHINFESATVGLKKVSSRFLGKFLTELPFN